MPIDQNITYRVNVDDSNFQAKLTQMRASLDATMGGAGMGGSPGFAFNAMGAVGSLMRPGNFGPMNLGGGYADFGSQVAPVTYTPPAIAMQPHFGMYQVSQTLGQAGLAIFGGPLGIGLGGMLQNGLFSNKETLSPRISLDEYMSASTRNLASRMGDTAAAGALGGVSLGANLALGGLGATAGASLFKSGVGKAVGGILGGMVVGTAVSSYADAVSDRMAENIGVQNTLAAGSFRFATGSDSDPLTGRGFNIANRRKIADEIQKLESNDTRFNMTDYSQILEGGMQMDMFSGTRDAEDFKKKFKDLVANVKTVSSTLHTSLKEGLEVIRGMRDMGVEGAGVGRLTTQSEIMGRASGRTGMEMLAIGQAGAEMFRGTGITMERGFTLAQQNTQMIRTMLNTGSISRETVAQAGGETALAQQMTAGALGGFQTLMGRGAMMANFDPKTGTFDANMVQKMMGSDAMSMLSNAANLGPTGIFKLQARQEELISKLSPMEMQMFGVAQRMSSARMLQGAFGGDLKDLFMAESKRQGIGYEQIKTEIGMLTTDPQKFADAQRASIAAMANQEAGEAWREQWGEKKLSNALTRAFIDPIASKFLDVRQTVEQGVSNIKDTAIDFLTGRRTVDKELLDKTKIDYGKELVSAKVKDRVSQDVQLAIEQREKETGKKVSEAERREIERESERKAYESEVLKSQAGQVIDDDRGLLGNLWGQKSTGLADAFGKNIDKSGKATYGGAEGRVVSSMAEAKRVGKEFGELAQVLKTSEGKMIAIRASDLGKIAEYGRKYSVTDEAIDAAKVDITVGDKGRLQEDIEALRSQKRTTEEQLAYVGTQVIKDFDVKKFLKEGGKPEDMAKILSAVKTVDPTLYKETRDRQKAAEYAADAAAGQRDKVSEMGLKAGEDARDRILDVVKGEGFGSFIGRGARGEAMEKALGSSQSSEIQKSIAGVLSGTKDSDRDLRILLRDAKVGDEKTIEQLVQNISKKKGTAEGRKIAEGLQTEATAAATASIVGGQATGLGQSTDYMAQGVAATSNEALSRVMEYSKSVENQIRILNALVTTLQGQLGGIKR